MCQADDNTEQHGMISATGNTGPQPHPSLTEWQNMKDGHCHCDSSGNVIPSVRRAKVNLPLLIH